MAVTFTINNKYYKVKSDDIPIGTTLNTFIRQYAKLSGTKFMCLEGGCGSCVVSIKSVNPDTQKSKIWAVNSCLRFLFSCDGLEITTIEGIGNSKAPHPIQRRLNQFNGSQCGYCSPGMLMNMFSLLGNTGGRVPTAAVENAFGGHICRCTGYRPILDAFKSLSVEDIEELPLCSVKGRGSEYCREKAMHPSILHMTFDDNRQWFKVLTIKNICEILQNAENVDYMLVAGNTEHGVYRRNRNIAVFIDVTAVTDLCGHKIGEELILGANVTLSESLEIFKYASKLLGFEYCLKLASHIELIANLPVRNAGTMAGNLILKHDHKEFPSDLFILLETVGAVLKIVDATNLTEIACSVAEFLDVDMSRKVITEIKLPKLDPNTVLFKSYKIMSRAQNAVAYVNAGFLIQFDDGRIKQARICYGGINPNFIHASKTEALLLGKDLFTNATIKETLQSLQAEIYPDWVLPDASPEYRKNLALSLFYKFVLNACPQENIHNEYRTGAEELQRPLSSGIQTFETNKQKWPLNEPVVKYEGLNQCTGQAKYVNDLPPQLNELWAAFVPAKKIGFKIGQLDATKALKIPGVRHFLSAKDIPGKNNFAPKSYITFDVEEIFLGNGEVLFYDQPVGMILADSLDLANYAAKLVEILYMRSETSQENSAFTFLALLNPFRTLIIENNQNNCKQIVPTLRDAIEMKAHSRDCELNECFINDNVSNVNQINGTFLVGGQYHFTMEPQSTVCVPAEDGIDVHASTMWMDFTQIAVAECLNIPENSVNIVVKHIGGGFGAKATRSALIACACAIGCHLTSCPVRFVMTIESNMSVIGKRYGFCSKYAVEFDDNGKIKKLFSKYAQDLGCSANEPIEEITKNGIPNCYMTDSWTTHSESIITDAPSNTYLRAPGRLEAIAMTETIMEHIAWATGLDGSVVRLANIDPGNVIRQMMPKFLNEIDYVQRKAGIEECNKLNRWRKRGISVVPMQYEHTMVNGLSAYIAVYHRDGTVAVSHGGTECGQGINTKVAQVAAYTLGIPLDMISVKPANNFIAANSNRTSSSITSDMACFATRKACEKLLARMKPVRDKMPDKAKWSDVTEACYLELIDLTEKHYCTEHELGNYFVFGMACSEIEIDVLTGNIQITRVDIAQDTGESISPMVDVGQVEGAFVMALGYWLTEHLVYDQTNGQLLTNRTWNYKPPGAKDIPIDFRIKLVQKYGNPAGILRSKGIGEPPAVMAVSVIFALRQALNSARKDAKLPDTWYTLGAGLTPERVFLLAGNNFEQYTL